MSTLVPTTPAEVAECVRRLTPCWRDMRKFYRARDDLAAAVAMLATTPLRPCASCASARHALMAARRERDEARQRADRAERLLARTGHGPRRRRSLAPPDQLSLWDNLL